MTPNVKLSEEEFVRQRWPDINVYRNKIIKQWLWWRDSTVDEVSAHFDTEEEAWADAASRLRAEEGIGENKAVVPEAEEARSLSYRKAGSSCLWCGEEMDHNCGYGACGNCCASLGNICHESPRGYEWLKKVVLSNIAKVEKRNSR